MYTLMSITDPVGFMPEEGASVPPRADFAAD